MEGRVPKERRLLQASGHPAGIPCRQPLKADKHLQQLRRRTQGPREGAKVMPFALLLSAQRTSAKDSLQGNTTRRREAQGIISGILPPRALTTLKRLALDPNFFLVMSYYFN